VFALLAAVVCELVLLVVTDQLTELHGRPPAPEEAETSMERLAQSLMEEAVVMTILGTTGLVGLRTVTVVLLE
jgi:hypothetical protein